MMNNIEYLEYIEQNLTEILRDPNFIRYKKQLIAWKLKVEFQRDYNENYLWNQLLYLSTKSCFLLENQHNVKLATTALTESAEIFEYLGEVSEKYDKEYCILLASLCYDIAGYQANATTLIKKLDGYTFIEENVHLSLDNYILEHIQLILQKNIFKARNSINKSIESFDIGIKLFNQSMSNLYDYILNGNESNFLKQLSDTYRYYLDSYNQYISYLLILLRTRLVLFQKRSLWKNLYVAENPILKKYIKLLAYDYYDGNRIKNENSRLSIFELWISQLRAIEKGLISENKNFVVQMPTSAGKTFIAEIAILNNLIKFPNKKCIYIAPFRALTTEKEIELKKYLSKLGYNISSLSGNYEIDDFQNLIMEDADVLVATPEKIDLLLRLNPEYFHDVSLMVIDEGHIIGEVSPRASLLEFLVTRLRIKIENLKTLFISAVMPVENADEYSIWLNNDSESVLRSLKFEDSPADEEWEPTRKLIGKHLWIGSSGNKRGNIEFNLESGINHTQSTSFVNNIVSQKQYGRKKFPKNDNNHITVALAHKLSEQGNTLIFAAKVKQTLALGGAFLEYFNLIQNNQEPSYFQLSTDKESYYYALKWLGEDHTITQCLKYGIGIHHGRLPSIIRTSIENDFRSNKLRVLIATNTVGQGLNFPIKNLIVHNTSYFYNNDTYVDHGISVRDFWNIIGRAGRAGKETEGIIVFMIKTDYDKTRFQKYTNKSHIENAISLIVKVLISYSQNNDRKKFHSLIKMLSEVFLLDLLDENLEGQKEIISKLINYSLFKVQAETKGLDLKPVNISFKKVVHNIKQEIDIEAAKVYGQTGLTIASNKAINEFIDDNISSIESLIQSNDHLTMVGLILNMFDTKEIQEINNSDNSGLESHSRFISIVQLWIQGCPIETIRQSWLEIESNIDGLFNYITDYLTYKYPWIISSFFTILNHKTGMSQNNYPPDIKNIVNYIKCGVNKESACFANVLGIKDRQACLVLDERSGDKTGILFLQWLSNLREEEIDSFGFDNITKDNVIDVISNITPNSKKAFKNVFQCFVQGTEYIAEYAQNSLQILLDSKLVLERDLNNKYDVFAIKVLTEQRLILGYLPREIAFILSPEIDINEKMFTIEIVSVVNKEAYNLVEIKVLR